MRTEEIVELVSHISFNVLNTTFRFCVKTDQVHGGRNYIQLHFTSPCTIDGHIEEWGSRKYYLSEYMTEDEIVKTCFMAAKQCVEHEVMEGFKFDNKIVFNPHINFRSLLDISDQTTNRS